jgi:hypothetical protein
LRTCTTLADCRRLFKNYKTTQTKYLEWNDFQEIGSSPEN